nr:DUF1048 domain-containing protein [Glycomyces xiaoerkulensis]
MSIRDQAAVAGTHGSRQSDTVDYRIVDDEMQKYPFKVGPASLTDGGLLSESLDLFESGATSGKGAIALIGPDMAASCDGLIGDSPTYADLYQEHLIGCYGALWAWHRRRGVLRPQV